MKKIQLGNSESFLSVIGVGAMSFTNFYGPTDKIKSFSILNEALDSDINHVDTANIYGMGESECIIGEYLKKQGKQKNNLFKIATKAGIMKDPKTGKRVFKNTRPYLESELDQSLKRLNVENVELFYIHRKDPDLPIQEICDYLDLFKKKGKINNYGFSEIAPSTLKLGCENNNISAIQSEYSIATRSPELGLTQFSEKNNITFVAFSPICRGLLTDAPPAYDHIQTLSFLKEIPRFQNPNYTKNIQITDVLRKLSLDLNIPTSALALSWLINKTSNIVTIPGTRSVSHLKELVKGAEFKMNDRIYNTIENILPLGWAHGDRYSTEQWNGPERYC